MNAVPLESIKLVQSAPILKADAAAFSKKFTLRDAS
jgi:hypothetical protein